MNETKNPTLILTRGLPASGKKTWAENWLREAPETRRLVCHDDIRPAAGITGGVGDSGQEALVTQIQLSLLRAHLRAGHDVVVADTNLRRKRAKDLVTFAKTINPGVAVEVQDFDVPLEELLSRDAARIADGRRGVGEEVLRTMAARFPLKQWWDVEGLLADAGDSPSVAPYVQDALLPPAVLVDVDGTIAEMVDRSPYDYSRVGEDLPVATVIDAVRAAHNSGYRILVLSGRSDACFDATQEWLEKHGVPFHELHMRRHGDHRADWLVKDEILRQQIQGRFFVRFCYDDRNQVVDHYRRLGLTVMQVAPGDF